MIQEDLRRHRRRKRMIRTTLAAAVLLAAVAAFLFFHTELTEITVEGNSMLSAQAVEQLLFETPMEKRTFYARYCSLFGIHKTVPMLVSYQLEFHGLHGVSVTVEEEPLAGGISYVDTWLYFDRNGYLMGTASAPIDGVPLIDGIVVRQPMLYQQLQTDTEEAFSDVCRLSGLLSDAGLSADRISRSESGTYSMVMGTVTVELGLFQSMEGKLAELSAMESQGSLDGLSGTLYLDTYGDANNSGSYIFKRD